MEFISKENKNWEYKVDNNSFLFSMNLQKIYHSIKDKKVICDIGANCGFCFFGGLNFYDNCISINDNDINENIKDNFIGLEEKFEINGDQKQFNSKELEVLKLL